MRARQLVEALADLVDLDTDPTSLLAVFVVDSEDAPLTIPDTNWEMATSVVLHINADPTQFGMRSPEGPK